LRKPTSHNSTKRTAFKKRIATTIEMGRTFYTAEKYHQDFLVRNPTYPYIVYNDLPKIENSEALVPGDVSPRAGVSCRSRRR
jgi:peptide-methionine (S)-S-oxide reductase